MVLGVVIRAAALLSSLYVGSPTQADQSVVNPVDCQSISAPGDWGNDPRLNEATNTLQKAGLVPHVVIRDDIDPKSYADKLIDYCDSMRSGNGRDARLVLVVIGKGNTVHTVLGSIAVNRSGIKDDPDEKFEQLVKDAIANGDKPGAAAQILDALSHGIQSDQNKRDALSGIIWAVIIIAVIFGAIVVIREFGSELGFFN